jgi:hypothetical protein
MFGKDDTRRFDRLLHAMIIQYESSEKPARRKINSDVTR